MVSISRPSQVRPRWFAVVVLSFVLVWFVSVSIGASPANADHVEPNDFAPEQEQPIDAAPANPQPDAGALAPGLSVSYWQVFVRDIKEIADLVGRRKAKPGPALAKLDYRTGDGLALTSGERDGIGAWIKGYIKLDKPGTYRFVANSNDGIRFTLAEELLFEDPDVHGDQMTNWADVVVAEPGWYDLQVLYFERKGTSTLQFYWKAPGAEDYEIVPESAFAHKKG